MFPKSKLDRTLPTRKQQDLDLQRVEGRESVMFGAPGFAR